MLGVDLIRSSRHGAFLSSFAGANQTGSNGLGAVSAYLSPLLHGHPWGTCITHHKPCDARLSWNCKNLLFARWVWKNPLVLCNRHEPVSFFKVEGALGSSVLN